MKQSHPSLKRILHTMYMYVRQSFSMYSVKISIALICIFSITFQFSYGGENNFKNSEKITAQDPENQNHLIIHLLDSGKLAKKNYQYDAYLQYALRAFKIAVHMNNDYYRSQALRAAGDAYYYKNEFQNSIDHYIKAEEIARRLNDSILIADISVDLAFTYVVNGRPDSAIFHAYDALKFYRTKDYPLNKAWCYRILGDIQYSLSNFDKSLERYRTGIEILQSQECNDSLFLRELSLQTGSIAMVLGEQKKIKESIALYKKSDSLALLCNALDVIAGNKYGLAYAYIYAGDYKASIDLNRQATKYFEETNDLFYLEGCWEAIGRAYLYSQNLDSAEYYLKKAEASAAQNNGYEFTKEVYKMLSLLYEKKGDVVKSFDYYKLFKAHSDSLYSKNKMYQLEMMQMTQTLEDTEKQNIEMEKSMLKDQALIAEQRKANILMGIALALVIISAILLAYFYQHKRHQSKILQKIVEKRTAAFNKANEALMQANKELQEFANISFHDMREPIRNIKSFTKLIRKKGEHITHQELDEFTSIIQMNAKQLQILVYDVFEFVNVDTDKHGMNEFSPDELVDDIVDTLDKNIKEKSVTISRQIDVESIKSNKGMLSIALKNLVENAVKYNHSENPVVHIRMHNGNDQYTWYVKDNGIGIESQYHERIFEMFKRLHNREKYHGSGLGLSITKKIIQKLDGRIGVISEEGKGSTFWFSIPKVD